MRVKFQLQKVLSIFKQIVRIVLDKIRFLTWRLFADKTKEYLSLNNMVEVDQLGNPDPEKISKIYGKINDPESALRFGTRDLEEYSFWSWRSCGVANALATLKTVNLFEGTLYDLVIEMRTEDGYLFEDGKGNKDLGWKHSILVKLFRKRNLFADVLKRVVVERVLFEILKERIVITSVKSRTNQDSSHMLTVYGFFFRDNKIILKVFDPYFLDGEGGNKEVLLNDFKKIFLNKGITISTK